MRPRASFDRARRWVLGLWLALGADVCAWLLAGRSAAAGAILVILIAGPLLAPLPGLLAGRRRSYRWAPLTLAPSLALALTELVANPPARHLAGLTALLAFLCLAAIVAALRSMPQG
jgi:uncharacterized membrane protein